MKLLRVTSGLPFRKLLLPCMIVILSLFVAYHIGRAVASDTPVVKNDYPLKRIALRSRALSWKPRVFYFESFLTPDECDQIVALGQPKLKRSQVIGPNGTSIYNDARTSYGTFLTDFMDKPLIKSIYRRISDWTTIPGENGEIFYLLRYEQNQEYKPHLDILSLTDNSQRIATVLMYLSDSKNGGETHFPIANLTVSPKKGDAILFFNIDPTNQLDKNTLHASLPVRSGIKWSLTCWLRQDRQR